MNNNEQENFKERLASNDTQYGAMEDPSEYNVCDSCQ